jgi:hypothetical protein
MKLLLLISAMLLWVVPAHAEPATLTWTAPTAPDLAGYKLYQYDATGQWLKPVLLGKVTTTTLTITTPGKRTFLVTALDVTGNESKPSNEVSKVFVGTVIPPVVPPTPKYCVAASTVSPTENLIIKGVPCVH